MFKKIYIEITNMCNLKCEFCIPCNRRPEMMSVDKFREIIKKVSKYTKVVTLHVKGEPFLHNDLESILKFVALKFVITLNFFTKQKINR